MHPLVPAADRPGIVKAQTIGMPGCLVGDGPEAADKKQPRIRILILYQERAGELTGCGPDLGGKYSENIGIMAEPLGIPAVFQPSNSFATRGIHWEISMCWGQTRSQPWQPTQSEARPKPWSRKLS